MSTINWPSSPTVGQFFSFQGKAWTYNGRGWQALSGPAIDIRIRRHDYVAPYSYCGTAPNSSFTEADPVWEITRIQILDSGNTIVTKATNVAWVNRSTSTYT
jgi:hypothetical protein